MINTLFNDIDYQISQKQMETFDRYIKVIQWGRRYPLLFLKDFLNIELTDYQKYCFMGTWGSQLSVLVCSRSSGKSYLSAPYIMCRTLLIPNHHTYIMAPSGGQSSETFQKLESLATNNIASAVGVTPFFLENCMAANAHVSPFTHDKSGYHVECFNGSTVDSLNSVAKNIVGIRSNLNVYDEAGKILLA